MRDYAQISPRFWTGETGKKLRGHLEAQVVAMYLMSAPGSHMIGMYPLELPTLCHHIGITSEGASKGLARLVELGFCRFDAEAELVWVPEMASYQIAEHLKKGDKRIKGVENELENYKKSKFYNQFVERYGKCFNLSVEPQPTASPSEAPSKPGTGTRSGTGARAEEPSAPASGSAEKVTAETWLSYSTAYRKRHGAEPVRNATVNGQLAAVIRRIGAKEAPAVAEFYVGHPDYARKLHPVGLLLQECESLRTQWATKTLAQPGRGQQRAGAPVNADTQSDHAADAAGRRA